MEWQKGSFILSTDKALLKIDLIHEFLNNSYWAAGIPRSVVEQSVEHSMCFGLYQDDRQIGFARVISDHATFAYLSDVFILPEMRGLGLSKWLMECIQSIESLQGIRRFMLATADAHGLYEQFGFQSLEKPERIMEIMVSDIYQKAS
ncbi:GNAT family N-acetyltransferase [Endozoicomonas arenosclerae]|uniref:GNAT family N-acetyltransferase n=1 Tax=Endozoicomonas arenosclerae TaxID=1633495 RepID=UPI0007836B15|nr:GNAT family N-acetyltransferase [Endozoicomonas arenosclerae]